MREFKKLIKSMMISILIIMIMIIRKDKWFSYSMDQQEKGENLGDGYKKNVCRHHTIEQQGLQTGCEICEKVSLFYMDIDI